MLFPGTVTVRRLVAELTLEGMSVSVVTPLNHFTSEDETKLLPEMVKVAVAPVVTVVGLELATPGMGLFTVTVAVAI